MPGIVYADYPGAIVTFCDLSLEPDVVHIVILNLHCETPNFLLARDFFRNRPALQCSVHFQAEVVMMVRREMFLNDETIARISYHYTC